MTRTPQEAAKQLTDQEFPIGDYEHLQMTRKTRLKFFEERGIKVLIEKEKEIIAFGEEVLAGMKAIYSLRNNVLRKLMIERIEGIKKFHSGFPKGTMRWANVVHENIHISQLDFNTLSDEKLFTLFESVIKKHYTQM
jgi:hypothetical protein